MYTTTTTTATTTASFFVVSVCLQMVFIPVMRP